jgi:catalase
MKQKSCETPHVPQRTRSSLLQAHEAELAALERDLEEKCRAIKRRCTDAVAQAARDRDVARGQLREELLLATARIRTACDAVLEQAAATQAGAVEAAEQAADKAYTKARERYEEVSNEQSHVLRERLRACEFEAAAVAETVRQRHMAELVAFDDALKTQVEV